MNQPEFRSEIALLRQRIDELYREALTPAIASYLRLMAEAALVVEGSVSPEEAPLWPSEYGLSGSARSHAGEG